MSELIGRALPILQKPGKGRRFSVCATLFLLVRKSAEGAVFPIRHRRKMVNRHFPMSIGGMPVL